LALAHHHQLVGVAPVPFGRRRAAASLFELFQLPAQLEPKTTQAVELAITARHDPDPTMIMPLPPPGGRAQ
jgi:hypothetical protein